MLDLISMNVLLSFAKKSVFLLCLLAFVACSDDDSSNSDSFDPDGIAHLNNGDSVDFSQYENVFTGEFESVDKEGNFTVSDTVPNGITDISWSNSNSYYFFVGSDETEKWRYTKILKTPYFVKFENGDSEDKTEVYAGTFSLKKRNDGFYITIITNKKQIDYELEPISETRETYKYLVGNGKLVFLN